MVIVSMNRYALDIWPGGRAQLRATCLSRPQRRSQQGIRPRRRGRSSEVPARSPSASTRSGPVISCPVSGTYGQDQFTVEPAIGPKTVSFPQTARTDQGAAVALIACIRRSRLAGRLASHADSAAAVASVTRSGPAVPLAPARAERGHQRADSPRPARGFGPCLLGGPPCCMQSTPPSPS